MTCLMLRARWPGRLALFFTASVLLDVNAASAQSMILPEGLTISLETRQDISSKTAKEGDAIDLAVAKAVTISGVTLIATGTPVTGEVVRVRDNGLLGRSGKLDLRVSKVMVGQQEVPVRGVRNVEGKSGTLGSIGAGILFLPLSFLVRGKDVHLPAGTAFDVYVDKEVRITAVEPPGMVTDANSSPPSHESNGIRAIDPNEALMP